MTNCHQLKILASDGKMRLTDVGDVEQILRLIQSIPSKKAEPFKLWLSKVGSVITKWVRFPTMILVTQIYVCSSIPEFFFFANTQSDVADKTSVRFFAGL